jgi:hypothetical protein
VPSRRLFSLVPLFVVMLTGCEPLTVSLPTRETLADTFPLDPPGAGTVTGRWKWTGPVPMVPQVQITRTQDRKSSVVERPNPYRLSISNGCLTSGVVALKPMFPLAPRRWPTIIKEVPVSEDGFEVTGPILLPLGESITFRSQKTGITGVRGRGADTFSRMLPATGATTEHTFDRPGRVELSMVSGEFWARADVYVSPYPWIGRPASDGRFCFEGVPTGEYELIGTHPNWLVVGHERDPETGALVRWRYGKPLVVVSKVLVTDGGVVEANLTTTAADFSN